MRGEGGFPRIFIYIYINSPIQCVCVCGHVDRTTQFLFALKHTVGDLGVEEEHYSNTSFATTNQYMYNIILWNLQLVGSQKVSLF